MKETRFKFGQKVKVVDSFFGNLEGTVLAVQETKKGIWPFAKKRIFYQVDTVVLDTEGNDLECQIIIEETFLREVGEKFSPKVIK